MNIEDITKAVRAKERINSNRKAMDNIVTVLGKYAGGNSDGSSKVGEDQIYSLRIGEYSGGSGFSADLTGSMIQTELLEYAFKLLSDQVIKDEQFIESL